MASPISWNNLTVRFTSLQKLFKLLYMIYLYIWFWFTYKCKKAWNIFFVWLTGFHAYKIQQVFPRRYKRRLPTCSWFCYKKPAGGLQVEIVNQEHSKLLLLFFYIFTFMPFSTSYLKGFNIIFTTYLFNLFQTFSLVHLTRRERYLFQRLQLQSYWRALQ